MLKQRHYLAHFDAEEFEVLKPAILNSVLLSEVSGDLRSQMEAVMEKGPIPGIVCRPPAPLPDDQGQVGFSFPIKWGEQRVRSTAAVHANQVRRFSSPWDVTERAIDSGMAKTNPALAALVDACQEERIGIGLIGSWAMQAMTGHAYTDSSSDLDIVVHEVTKRKALTLISIISSISSQFDVKVDCEVVLQSKLGVKLSEFTTDSKTLLGKSVNGVELVSRSTLASLN